MLKDLSSFTSPPAKASKLSYFKNSMFLFLKKKLAFLNSESRCSFTSTLSSTSSFIEKSNNFRKPNESLFFMQSIAYSEIEF